MASPSSSSSWDFGLPVRRNADLIPLTDPRATPPTARRLLKQQADREYEKERKKRRVTGQARFMGQRQRANPNDTAFRRHLFATTDAGRLPRLPQLRPMAAFDDDDDPMEGVETENISAYRPALRYALGGSKARADFLSARAIRAPTAEQESGAAFMIQRMRGELPPVSCLGGGVLDDMRMGKCQLVAMALLADIQHGMTTLGRPRFGPGMARTLVIATPDSAPGWVVEFEKALGKDVLQVRLLDTEHLPMFEKFDHCREDTLRPLREEVDVVVTTYDMLALSTHNFLADFLRDPAVRYRNIICDEAHYILNEATRGFQVVMSLQAECRWILTGTPIQNTIQSLRPELRLMNVPEHQVRALHDDEELVRFARAMVIRRARDGPKKPLPVIPVKWDRPLEAELHAHVANTLMQGIEESHGVSLHKGQFRILNFLRQYCMSPYMCYESLFCPVPPADDDEDEGEGQEPLVPLPEWVRLFSRPLKDLLLPHVAGNGDDEMKLMEDMTREDLGLAPRLLRHPLRECTLSPMSPKERWVCNTLLRDYADVANEKVVLFSHYRAALDRLATLLSLRLAWGVPGARGYAHVHGSLQPSERQAERDRFTNDPQCGILLAMIDVNKEGLDLTAANHAVLYDPWWNPTPEFQATGRIRGLAQTRPTYVYRLAMVNTLDASMTYIADRKLLEDLQALPITHVGADRDVIEEQSNAVFVLRALRHQMTNNNFIVGRE